MRSDAARNLDAVLQTGARLLADDPGATVASIATEAGVDRRTVYRRFASRDELVVAVVMAKLDAIAGVLDGARLEEAPVLVALHRLMEGVVAVSRRFPIDVRLAECPERITPRMAQKTQRLEAFVARGVDEGMFRADLPDGVALAMVEKVIEMFALGFHDLECGRAADLAVEILLGGVGTVRRS